MKAVRWVLLIVLYALFAGSLLYAAGALPQRVATHFGWHGEADGWMSKEADLLLMAAVGVGLPLFLIGICYATRFFPARLVNLPNHDYWLAPERRKETAARVASRAVWLACMMLTFLTVLHLLVVFANQKPSPQLSTPLVLGLGACFIVGAAFWVRKLFQDFNRPLEGAQ